MTQIPFLKIGDVTDYSRRSHLLSVRLPTVFLVARARDLACRSGHPVLHREQREQQPLKVIALPIMEDCNILGLELMTCVLKRLVYLL